MIAIATIDPQKISDSDSDYWIFGNSDSGSDYLFPDSGSNSGF